MNFKSRSKKSITLSDGSTYAGDLNKNKKPHDLKRLFGHS